ncbi:MAG: hypothetical protein HY537_00915 [Deltaproteobacteria bacterium]|nr:hypothetical protein [Deltaproteobacteria bacterium]
MNASFHMGSYDEKVFGFPVARCELRNIEQVIAAIRYAQTHAAKLIVVRCPSTETATIHHLENEGFRLMDTLIRFVGSCRLCIQRGGKSGIRVFPLRETDSTVVGQIARKSFHAYPSHLHSDPRLDRSRCDDYYERWSLHCCAEREHKREVFVAQVDGQIVGFGVTRLVSPNVLQGVLAGVMPNTNGFYTLRSLLIRSLKHALELGAGQFEISTVLNNLGMQRLCTRVGFEHRNTLHTFHRWLE